MAHEHYVSNCTDLSGELRAGSSVWTGLTDSLGVTGEPGVIGEPGVVSVPGFHGVVGGTGHWVPGPCTGYWSLDRYQVQV